MRVIVMQLAIMRVRVVAVGRVRASRVTVVVWPVLDIVRMLKLMRVRRISTGHAEATPARPEMAKWMEEEEVDFAKRSTSGGNLRLVENFLRATGEVVHCHSGHSGHQESTFRLG